MKIFVLCFFAAIIGCQSFGQSILSDDEVRAKVVSLAATDDISRLKQLLQPVIDDIGHHTIIGLGEGTHGTKEFTVLRSVITQMLVEQKGFTTVCVESPYGDMYQLDTALRGNGRVTTELMKRSLFSIYQTREFRDFLEWVQRYNKDHAGSLRLAGIDYAYIGSTAIVLKKLLSRTQIPAMDLLTDSIVLKAVFIDSCLNNLNERKKNTGAGPFQQIIYNCIDINRYMAGLEQLAKSSNFTFSETENECLYNLRAYVEGMTNRSYGKKARSRDEVMASMVDLLAGKSNSKIIVWAHNAHIAGEPTINNDGGMGGYIKKNHPAYFALGTGTAAGTYSATRDRFINNQNVFSAYPLKKPVKDSWEHFFSGTGIPVFFLPVQSTGARWPHRRLRAVGYRSGVKDYYMNQPLEKCFDGFIFIRITSAADHKL